jgi:hypothetical protein
MEHTYRVEADVHFDETDLKDLSRLLQAIENATGDLADGLAGYGQGPLRLYNELRTLADGRP